MKGSDLLVIVNKSPGIEQDLADQSNGKMIYDLAGLRPAGVTGGHYSGIAW